MMTCNDESCYLDITPDEKYKWLGSIKKEGLSCSLKNRHITAKKKICFTNIAKLKISIIIWSKDIIST